MAGRVSCAAQHMGSTIPFALVAAKVLLDLPWAPGRQAQSREQWLRMSRLGSTWVCGLAFYGQVHGGGWAWGWGWGWGGGAKEGEEATLIICEIVSKTLLTQIIGHKFCPEIRE